MPFSEVLYQIEAQSRLQRGLRAGRLPHALLFTGPDGVGKGMLARRLASVLLCAEPQEISAPSGVPAGGAAWIDACGGCEDCVLDAAGTHPDFHFIERTLNRFHPNPKVQQRKAIKLSVDVIRYFVIERVGLRPGRGRAKVFIVDEADRMSDGAQNALLKTLEEPPSQSYLILLALSADRLLPTTRSRCHHVALRRLPSEFVVEQLSALDDVTREDARFLAELSQGSLGLARRCLNAGLHLHLSDLLEALQAAPDDPLQCGRTLAETAKQLTGGLKGDSDDSDATDAARQGQAVVLAAVATVLRDVQRIAVGLKAMAFGDATAVAALARRTTPGALGGAIRAMGTAEYQIGRNANTSLIFDAAGVAIGRGLGAG